MINVLVVDDSAFMRNALSSMISSDPEITIIGTARDGVEAVDKVAELKPDIVTLDVEMPRMNGIEALKLIMEKTPVPVIMVSRLTTEGVEVTLDALDIGAVDFIPKNLSDLSINIVKIKEVLIEKIKNICRNGNGHKRVLLPSRPLDIKQKTQTYSSRRTVGIVSIGSSTGGPRALQSIISSLPENYPVPVLIAQHMPASFTGPFAERLNHLSAVSVKEAEDGEAISEGHVYIAPGGCHMGIAQDRLTKTTIKIVKDNGKYIYKPSVDFLMQSVVEFFSGHVLGVILTGLGNDGAKGMKEIKNKGGRTIAESEESCIVYGMPRAVINSGCADKIIPLTEIAGELINAV